MGTATVHTQTVADRLGLALDRIVINDGVSTLPGSFIAGGATQTMAIGGAIAAAHRALVAKLLALVGSDSPLAGRAPCKVIAVDGCLVKRDAPLMSERYESILERAGHDEVTVEEAVRDPVVWQQRSMHSFSALFREARINAVTGEIRIALFRFV